jgi:hypothetical protein
VRYSPRQAVVSLVIAEAESPAARPKNPSNAGTKSCELSPRKYSSGRTSVTFGLRRHHGGRIALVNFRRCPVSGSTRLSFTRGARTTSAPATVVISRARACPLRTTSRHPASSSSSASAST